MKKQARKLTVRLRKAINGIGISPFLSGGQWPTVLFEKLFECTKVSYKLLGICKSNTIISDVIIAFTLRYCLLIVIDHFLAGLS